MSSEDKLQDLLQRIAEDAVVPLDSEEATKQGIILPILSRVGWDRDDVREVIPEHPVENGRVDYCLRVEHKNVVFIEAKRTDQELDRHQEQLLDYAFREGVELAALTNGLMWWLYLPLLRGSWEQRKFLTIDITQQEPSAVADHFRTFLSRSAVVTGSAIERATALHESRAKERLTAVTLPKAWTQLVQEPDELLAQLLADRVASLCGHQPTPDQMADFLNRVAAPTGPTTSPPGPAPEPSAHPPHTPRPRRASAGGYTFSRPSSFSFRGSEHPASTWKEVLVGLCAEIAKLHPDSFSKVLQLRGRKRDYFSRDFRGMTNPQEVPGTSVFVETNLSANDVAKRCRQVLHLFGYKDRDFHISAG